MYGQAGAFEYGVNHGEHIGEIEAGMYALRVEVHGEYDGIDVAGAFAVAKNGALDAVAASQYPKLSSSNSTAWDISARKRDSHSPRSLWVCRLMMHFSRSVIMLQKRSTCTH